MKFSSKVLKCGLSPMRKFHPYAVAAEAKGRKIYHLNIGQPDIETPKAYFDAVKHFDLPVLAYAPSPGIPELIDAGENGELFESGNADALAGKIRALWGDRARLDAYTKACGKTRFDTVEAYAEKLMRLYQG